MDTNEKCIMTQKSLFKNLKNTIVIIDLEINLIVLEDEQRAWSYSQNKNEFKFCDKVSTYTV